MALERAQLQAHRDAMARNESLRTLRLGGSVFATVSLANDVLQESSRIGQVLDLLVAVNLLVMYLLLRSGRIRDALVPWIMAHSAVAISIGTLVESWVSPSPPDFAYIVIFMVVFPPFIMSWAPTVASQLPLMIGFVALAGHRTDDFDTWLLVALASSLVGFVLLAGRLQIIDDLAETAEMARSQAIRDKLTGVLNRHGLEERIGDLLALARRRQEPMFATFVDIDGLKQANDVHGHDFGDEVICTVAHAIRDELREGDVVARWGGDEFVVIGFGQQPSIESIEQRLRKRIHESGIDLARWPGHVSVGMASANADVFDDLLTAADADMYERRRARRGHSGRST